jgi:hypothetical protein
VKNHRAFLINQTITHGAAIKEEKMRKLQQSKEEKDAQLSPLQSINPSPYTVCCFSRRKLPCHHEQTRSPQVHCRAAAA